MFPKHRQSLLLRFGTIVILIMAVAGIVPIQPVHAATLTVTNTNNGGAGSLRSAIRNAAPGDIVTFALSLSGQTITLTSTLVINKNITIDGSSLPSKVNISGNNQVMIFLIVAPAKVTMKNLVIKNGYSANGTGGIYNDGYLTMIQSDITGNAGASGGGIKNGGTLLLSNSTISSNVAAVGGGIDNRGNLRIARSVVTGNAATSGGGIWNSYGTITVVNSTVSNNSATSTAGGTRCSTLPP